MSKQDKKETTTFSSSSSSPSTDNYHQGYRQQSSSSSSFNRTTEENRQSLNQSLDETKKSIQKNLDEARGQIPRYTQSISDAQEHTIQATKEIADNYIEYQKQALNSLQSIFAPYIENVNNQSQNNRDYFSKKLPEIYSKIASNYAENTIAVSRMFNDLVFANVDSFKNIANTAKEHSKHLSEIGKRNARVCEGIHQDNLDNTGYSSTTYSQNK
jgi:DNA anti-recombination protein RmuC